MERGSLGGVAPVLLVLLARAGVKVVAATPFSLSEAAARSGDASETVPGIRIDFQSGERIACVYYFQQDLRDHFFAKESAVARFVTGLGRPGVLLKSASYLLHEPNFANIRDLIVRRSSLLVQDPSSMPYRLLAESGWKVDLYGCYTQTTPSFRKYEQVDLARAFGNSAHRAGPLSFGIGYHTDPESASLMVAMPAA